MEFARMCLDVLIWNLRSKFVTSCFSDKVLAVVKDKRDESMRLACEAGGQSDSPRRGRRAWGYGRKIQQSLRSWRQMVSYKNL